MYNYSGFDTSVLLFFIRNTNYTCMYVSLSNHNFEILFLGSSDYALNYLLKLHLNLFFPTAYSLVNPPGSFILLSLPLNPPNVSLYSNNQHFWKQ